MTIAAVVMQVGKRHKLSVEYGDVGIYACVAAISTSNALLCCDILPWRTCRVTCIVSQTESSRWE